MPGFTPEQRKEIEEFVVSVVRRDNLKRAGSPDDRNRRVSPHDSVEPDQHVENGVDARAIKGLAGNDNPGNDGQRAVGTGHAQDGLATTRVIRDGAVQEGKLGPGLTGGANDAGPAQGQKGVRKLGAGLGGNSQGASPADHSHGSGNTMDFDYLREDQKRRVLAQRLVLRRDLERREGDVTREEARRLQSLVLTLLHILTDAPDMDAFHRERLRRAGVPFLEFFEYRQRERHGDAGPRHYQGSERQRRGVGWLHDRSQRHYRGPHPDLEA